MTDTNITDQHLEVFAAITSGKYTNFALFSCFVNGEPASAIVAISEDGPDFTITPLFISVTDNMVLTDHDDTQPQPR